MHTQFTADLARTRVEDKLRTAQTARLARLIRGSRRLTNPLGGRRRTTHGAPQLA